MLRYGNHFFSSVTWRSGSRPTLTRLDLPRYLVVLHLDKGFDLIAKVNRLGGRTLDGHLTRGDRVVAYDALATAGVEKAQSPEQLTKGGVTAQTPCLLLVRLAVDRSEHNRGLGKGLLVDAIRRAVRVSDEVGVRALLIHARDDEARAFYLHQAEFPPSLTDPLHLFLSIKHARQLVAGIAD